MLHPHLHSYRPSLTPIVQITHSEWSSSDAYSASAGSGLNQRSNGTHASFKRLPYTFCALSLQPFTSPVCTPEGLIFDHENILRWLITHDTNPVNGLPLKQSDLIKLQFAKNEAGEYVDPVTFKAFTDNSHIVAVRHDDRANVFAYDTVERLNIKAKMWRDLVSDEEFARKDIIKLQDPQNLDSRDLSSFKYLKDGEDTGIQKEKASVNADALGSSAKIIDAKRAVARARAERAAGKASLAAKSVIQTSNRAADTQPLMQKPKSVPYNASHHTTGLAAASFTSTGVTPHTSGALALLSDEEYLLKRGRVKQSGFVRLQTNHGELNIELLPEHAPKAVWNFVRLAQKGYYNGMICHRNIRNFMLQTGDPTGTGRGGASIWGKNFEDEIEGPLKHDLRGVVSMANKGKNTNSSQFFITYRAASHLDRKHTVFGRVVDGMDVLRKLEDVPVDPSTNRPKEEVKVIEAVVYVDPFEEFWKNKREGEEAEKEKEERKKGDEERTTWTGKRIRHDGTVQDDGGVGVGKYLRAAMGTTAEQPSATDEIAEYVDDDYQTEQPVKKSKGGSGFGNFDGW